METNRLTHTFSIEIISKEYVKHLSLSNESRNGVYFEGFLGDITGLGYVNGGMLEIIGINGTFRMDIRKEELRKMLAKEVD